MRCRSRSGICWIYRRMMPGGTRPSVLSVEAYQEEHIFTVSILEGLFRITSYPFTLQ